MRKFKKLNRKGFTLIELLAVIVILAVIMVIAGTSVIGSMNSSKQKSLLASAQSAKDSFDMAYGNYLLEGSSLMGYTTSEIDNLLSGKPQTLSAAATKLDINGNDYNLNGSYVYFDSENSTFTVCMEAKNGGSLYLASAVLGTGATAKSLGSDGDAKTMAGMYACSDGTTSWQ